jgi:hypothetical protein
MFNILTLCTSLDALLFHTNDSLGKQLACQPWIRTEALPIATAISRSAQWPSYWSKCNMSSLA